MSIVPGSTPMSMASLYAMLGLAMPSGASSGPSGVALSPALAMLSAANDTVAAELGTLLVGMTGTTASARSTDLTTALMSLARLDPTQELQRLEATMGAQADSLDSGG
jgi:hypothetical protein